MTQHQKIINMCSDGNWHCGNEFRALFIFSPHKRRDEIAKGGIYKFKDRPCVHGHKNVLDYLMVKKHYAPVFTQPKQLQLI